jgi:hypothetical protein
LFFPLALGAGKDVNTTVFLNDFDYGINKSLLKQAAFLFFLLPHSAWRSELVNSIFSPPPMAGGKRRDFNYFETWPAFGVKKT